MENYLLLVYPILVLVLLAFQAKLSPKGSIWDDCWNRDDAKNIQVFAAFGVILHHLTQIISNYDKIRVGPIQIFTSMGILFTSIFFFYSGFGLMQSYKNKDKYLDTFLQNRMVVVLVPFMVTNLVYMLPGLSQYRITSVYAICTSLLGLTLINTNAWYLVEIIIFYLLFYFCFRFIKNKRVALGVCITIIIAMILGSVLLGHDFSNLNGHWFMGEWWFNSTIVFVMGLLFGLNRDRIVSFYKKGYIVKLIISIILFFASFYFEEIILHKYGYYHETHFDYNYIEKYITLGAQMLTCLLFVQMVLLITMKVRFGNKVLKLIIPFTFELYLMQDFCLKYYTHESKMPHMMIYIIAIVECILLALLVYCADKFIIGLIRQWQAGELSNSTTIEGTQKQLRIRSQMKAVLIMYAIVFLASVVLFGVDMYDRFKVNSDVTKKEMTIIQQANVGDEVEYGRIQELQWEKREIPIPWIVVEKKDNEALLVSKYALFDHYFNQKHVECSYMTSDVRKIINDDMLYVLFRPQELSHVSTNVETSDRAFLLSAAEVEKYFPDAESRTLSLINTSGKNPNKINTEKRYWWWIRSDDINKVTLYPPIVDEDGLIVDEYREVNRSKGMLRPAMWVDISRVD